MFTRLYLVSRAVLATPRVRTGIALGLVTAGARLLLQLAEERGETLRALENEIAARRAQLQELSGDPLKRAVAEAKAELLAMQERQREQETEDDTEDDTEQGPEPDREDEPAAARE